MASTAPLCFFYLLLASSAMFLCFARDLPSGTEDYRNVPHHPHAFNRLLSEVSGTENMSDVEDYPERGPNPRHQPPKPPPTTSASAAVHNG